jgi:hypothetical protein
VLGLAQAFSYGFVDAHVTTGTELYFSCRYDPEDTHVGFLEKLNARLGRREGELGRRTTFLSGALSAVGNNGYI